MPSFDWNIILAIAFGLLILYLLAKILYFPLKILMRLLLNGLCGGALLLVFNAVGSLWGLHLGVNFVTAVVVGVMGIPGVVMLLVLQRITG